MSQVKKVDGRTEKSRITRAKVLDAAAELFVRDGYGATALQDIAQAAGVAVQTIYYGFGNKQTVLKQVVDRSIAGDDEPVATMDRPWFREAQASTTADQHLRAHVVGTTEVLSRVAPIMKMLEAAAASDAAVADLWPNADPRLIVQNETARSLLTKPGAQKSVTTGHAADILYAVLSTELYLLLVTTRGWTSEQFADWAYDVLRPQLCT
ncbi:TetR/AcrR family transcriptional regulator [Kribbella italica]|uniref:AcrR family transcriptional regulator n=1 Tax=Kribbella italica TaxID=1540520 RepID=A0A7W9MS66_9ACTN|nr:TetR/AcrR family transcriptional regulator [Kribbella italica]MBB5834406.1 AcrR family transcriptional regulator [Kribbella italica]